MFGISPMELLTVAIIGVLALGIPVAIVVLLVLLLRKKNDGEGNGTLISQLRDENQRLREELAAVNQRRRERSP